MRVLCEQQMGKQSIDLTAAHMIGRLIPGRPGARGPPVTHELLALHGDGARGKSRTRATRAARATPVKLYSSPTRAVSL